MAIFPLGDDVKILLGLFAAGAMVAACSPASAQSKDVNDYVLDCANAADVQSCKTMSMGVDRDFEGAWKADYQGVRNISYCLLTGCEGAMRVDKAEGCGWRAIAYTLAPTGVDKLSEDRIMDAYCKDVPTTKILAYVQAITLNLE